jgi:putative ABC transport system permease protein
VNADAAKREVEAIAASPEFESWRKAGRRLGLVPLHEEIIGDKARVLMLLLAAAALVLTVACANLAQLLLARADGRLAEFATRKAIGATPAQIFRLAVFESVLMSGAGGAAGVGIAYGLVPVMLALAPEQIPRLAAASIDLRVLAAAATLSLATGCAFGLAPALRLSRVSVTQALERTIGAPSRRRSRFTSVAVVLQVTTAVLLFVLAGLVGQTFLRLAPRSPGFATDGRASFLWLLSERQFPDAADRRRHVTDWMEQMEAIPGILAVAVASRVPFGDDESLNVAVRRADDDRAVNDTTLRGDIRAVSVNYFSLLELPLVRGRPFQTADSGEAPRVAIVNQTLARRLDPSGDPLGLSIRLGSGAAPSAYEIVGVVADTRWWGMTRDPLNEVYMPLAQDRASSGYLIVRSQLNVEPLTRVMRDTFYASIPGAALPAERRAVPLEELVDQSIAGPRFSAVLIGSFAGATLLLAAFGLFGLVAYLVSQRRREFGIRVALGAQPRDLMVMSMRWALVLTSIGVISGLLAAAYVTRFLQSQLHGVQRLDAIVFVSAGIVMLCVAALAAYVPARGATRVDPMTAIRHQ